MSAYNSSFEEIAREIVKDVGTQLVTRPYLSIVDFTGNIHYIDDPLASFTEFIHNFVKSNFYLLTVGDHSLPLGGVNLAFFKVSDKAMIVIYTVKGLSGQLLAFKTKMFDYSAKIDALLGHITPAEPAAPTPAVTTQTSETASYSTYETTPAAPAPAPPPKKRGLRTVPTLTRELTGKEKFPIEVAQVLNFCDGKHSVKDICEKTGYTLLKINEIIRTYQKKKWVELKRIL